jgi:hypothetical protein
VITTEHTEYMNWTSAVTDLIQLTQKGRLNWTHGREQGHYDAELGDKKLHLVKPAPSSSSWSPFWPAGPNLSNVQLDIFGREGQLESRCPSIPALDGLVIAVEQFTSSKASELFDVIHSALIKG